MFVYSNLGLPHTLKLLHNVFLFHENIYLIETINTSFLIGDEKNDVKIDTIINLLIQVIDYREI